MAALAGGEEGTRAARLQSFFTSVLSGLFGQGEDEEEMATRDRNAAAAAAPQLHHHNRGEPMDPLSSWLLPLWFLAEGWILGDLGSD